MVVTWTLAANPSDNYLECNGQAVNSTKYPKLYKLMHNTPDFQGIFLRGLGGNSATLGELQGDAIRNIYGKILLPGNGSDSWSPAQQYSSLWKQELFGYSSEWGNYGTPYYWTTFDASGVVPTAEENRPINKSVRYFIKAK